ncbi:hypothetical protein COU58_00050 [Candidatus Pacearchaeota archaeon CG10_big_fil_rev_8_21_14_0_10_32_42]|nr:MAG: hypothetical protein COU58_00050 [Candidatus Pacearchaeota archaeon CG10_big_fil_rev_8_21_14_0_10_32_42]
MEKDIGKIPKNDQSEIVLRIDDFGGRRGFTIREFVTSERYTGFTKAGVRILSKDFPKFKEMVNSISDEDMKDDEGSEEPPKEKPAKKQPKNQEELPDY